MVVSDSESPDGTTSPGLAAKVDGRRAWRERNRIAVVDALLDFHAEGNLRPDASQVAERSGVSRRSIFRYFDDRDDLDRTAIARMQERVRPLLEIPSLGEGPLRDRIARIAEARVRLFEQVRPAARVTRLRAPFHPVMAAELEQARRFFQDQVSRQFAPELDAMDAATREETLAAADVLCSFEAYDLLKSRDVDAGAIASAMRRGLTGLFAVP